MPKTFDYQGAKESGYSDEEISSFLSEKHPKFDFDSAYESGYSPEEVNQFLSEYKPEQSFNEKAGRVAGQYGLGVLQGSPAGVAYDVSASLGTSKPSRVNLGLEDAGKEIEYLYDKNMGKPYEEWNDQDKSFYNFYEDIIKNPGKIAEQEAPDLSISSLAEKSTGIDTEPEGWLEQGARWMGYIRDPRNLLKIGPSFKPSQVIQTIMPTGKEALRGLGAGAALEIAKDGEFGPIGTIAATVVGDLIGAGVHKAGKSVIELATKPKETLAKAAAAFTSKDKIDMQKEIIKDFRDSGITADLGTLTDNNLVKWTQSRLAQSGLTGKALEDLKKQTTEQIKNEYRALADSLGQSKFSTAHEAGEVTKQTLKKIRDSDLAATRNFYTNANKSLVDRAFADTRKLSSLIQTLEKDLTPGNIKSAEQSAVLSALEKVKRDIYDSDGNLLMGKVKDLMNDKIALNDIINYEVQGGAKKLLKSVVAEIDRAIISHGKDNPSFAKNYVLANKKFSEHAKTFRNKEVEALLRDTDPAKLLNKMDSVHGIRQLDKILSKSIEGKEALSNLKRMKLDDVIGKNLVDSTTQQVKLGTFSKLLDKGKNKEVIKEILGSKAFKALERLQKNAGKLAESNNKFYNSSQSGMVAADAAVIYQGMNSFFSLLMGNPWPLMKVAGGIAGAKKLGRLLADPEFLNQVENFILAAEKSNSKKLISEAEKLLPYFRKAFDEFDQDESL